MSGQGLETTISWRGGWLMQEGERQFASDKDLANPFLPLRNAPLSVHLSDAKKTIDAGACLAKCVRICIQKVM